MFESDPNCDETHPPAPASAADVRLVIHDRDNTLVTENVSFYAYQYLLNEALHKHGEPEVGIKAIEALGVGGRYEDVLRILEEKYHVTIGDPAITDAHARYAPKMLEATEIMQRKHQKILPEVLGTTHILRAAGVAQVVCTNNDLAISDNGLKRAGLADLFPKDRTYSADDVFSLHPDKTAEQLIKENIGFKPAPDLYQHALEKEGCDGAHAIAIEDSVTGITAAKKAGIGIRIGTLSVHKQAGEDPEKLAKRADALRRAGATHIIESYSELLPVLMEHGTPEIAAAIQHEITKMNAAGESLREDPVQNAVANVELSLARKKSAQHPVTPSAAIHDFFNDDDCAFLGQMFVHFPEIEKEFDAYLAMEPAKRPEAAMDDLDTMPRIGPFLRRIPSPETVFDHSKRLGKAARALAAEVYKNSDILKLNDQEKERFKNELPPDTIDPQKRAEAQEKFASHLEKLADAHDLPEALVTDFPPNIAQADPSKFITKVEKKRIEKLAACVLYDYNPNPRQPNPDQPKPEGMKQYEEYEAKETLSARLLSDLDKLDPCRLVLVYETHCRDNSKNFDSHVATAREKMLTAYGNAELDALEANADKIRQKASRIFKNGMVNDKGERLRPVGDPSGLVVRSERRFGLGGLG